MAITFAQVRRYLRDPAVPAWRRWLLVLAAAYVVMPFDAIPDALPVLGWLDDVGAVTMALGLFRRDLARHAALAAPDGV
jgi:uncharacterized membrane protein YkvA (DUF1232 family)